MKKILALSLLGWLAFGQQRQTVYTQLWNAITTLPGTTTSLIQNNQGQTFHTITVTTVNSGGTCNPNTGFQLGSSFSGEIEASSDSVNYTSVAQRVSINADTVNNSQVKLYRATTAYPFVRFRILDFPASLPANCAISIFYSGSLTASGLSDSVYPINQSPFGFFPSSISTTCTNVNGATASGSAGFNNNIGMTGGVFVNPTATASIVSFYGGSSAATCGGSVYFEVVIPANSTVTIQPDSVLDALVPSSSRNGIYAKSSVGTMVVSAFLAYQN